jgi:predicted NAD/FAD-binding protein
MNDRFNSRRPRELTRRDALKSAASLGAIGLFGCGPAPKPTDESLEQPYVGAPRVAIIGGGAGGIATAYFLEGVCDVEIFESRPKIGGHCDSSDINYQGETITVDLGAQFFHPATHPIYTTLLEDLGLYDPAHVGADQTLVAPGSVCIFPDNGGWPRFSSTLPILTPISDVEFLLYAHAARHVVLGNMAWEVTLDDWIGSLLVSQRFKDDILYPWICALIGTTHENAAGVSARSILQTFALAFPANPLSGASTYNSKIGFEGNLRAMLARSPSAVVHVNSAVQALDFNNGVWSVQTPSGTSGPFDAVVLNAPPHASSSLLTPLSWASDIVSLLETYQYFDSRIVIHTDAAYVYGDRTFWAVYNAEVDGIECEGSVWLGGIHEKLPGGGTVDVFKSWAHHRNADPQNILLERKFRHPLITPDVIGAARALAATQGRNGLYFAGHFTTGMDLQETAVYSAMKVASTLAPNSASLASLQALLQLRGRAGISYDL